MGGDGGNTPDAADCRKDSQRHGKAPPREGENPAVFTLMTLESEPPTSTMVRSRYLANKTSYTITSGWSRKAKQAYRIGGGIGRYPLQGLASELRHPAGHGSHEGGLVALAAAGHR